MRISIRAKILIIFAATLIATSAPNLFLISQILKKDYRSALHSELLVLGNNLQAQLKRITSLGIETKNIEGFSKQCQELVKKNKHVIQAMVIDKEGTIIFHNDSSYEGKKLTQENVLSSITAGKTEIHSIKDNNKSTYFAVLPFGDSPDQYEYAVVICSPAKIINDKIFELINKCNVVLISSFGLAAVLLLIGLTMMLTSPLAVILNTMKDITKSRNLEKRVFIKTHDEIGQIADAFNTMTADLQQTTTSIDNLNREIAIRKQAQEKATTIIQTAHDGFWISDLKGRFIDVNDSYCKMIGYTRAELLAMSIPDIEAVETPEETAERIKKIVEQGHDLFETRHRCKDGTLIDINASVKYFDEDGGQMVVFLRDVTEQKKTAEAMKRPNYELKEAVEKLGRANNELKDFVYIASHDLREPLRKISAFGELLSASLKDKLNDDDKENFGFMIDGAKRMQQMIDALLTYSRITTKGVDFEAVDLNKVMKELCEVELAVKIEETCAKMTVPGQLHTVNGDPAQVRQLMQNFIANGLKYQKKGTIPQITIRSSAADNDMVRVEVADNGIGIKQEYFKNLFIMFRRLHSRQEYEGSGIGLAVCKKIVERHGGDIGVSSTYGEGSTFWFTMPAQKPSEEKQAQLVLSGEAGVREQQDS